MIKRTLSIAEIESLGTGLTENVHHIACVAAGTGTRLNHLYTEGLERLRRRQTHKRRPYDC